MPQVHRKAVSSEELEAAIGRDFGPGRFASMCNALVWAVAGKRCTTLPSFTERINVRDSGIDGEWTTVLPDDDNEAPLLGPGWNVFQYKQREIAARGRTQAIGRLKTNLRGAVEKLWRETERRPDRYALFTNVDLTNLTAGEKGELRNEMLEGYDRPYEVVVEILGAGDLASYLNDLPHLRYAFFGAPAFCTVEEEWARHTRAKRFGSGVDLMGRDEEFEELKAFLADPQALAMVIAGPRDIGKSRLALEAAKTTRPTDTIVALEPESLAAGDVLALRSPHTEPVILVEDPDPEQAERLVHQALASMGVKLLVTLPTAENAPTPGYGQDERVRTMRLGPLSDEKARELLRSFRPDLDYGIEAWVVERASGNPGVLLAAANAGQDLRETASSFAEEVGRQFERKVRTILGDQAVRILEVLSILSQVGVQGNAEEELTTLLGGFGSSLTAHDVLGTIPRLVEAGLVRPRGSYVEVTPNIFADHLCASALRGRSSELVQLFSTLGYQGRLRLLRRLQGLTVDGVGWLWETLLGADGPIQGLPSALSVPDLLRPVAAAAPDLFVVMVEKGLSSMNLEERFEIAGKERRELVWALQECLYRRRTSESALRCLSQLAEAETEDHGNNATGIFCECFMWSNPQFPLPLSRRIRLLEHILKGEVSTGLRLLAVRATESSITQRMMMLFTSQGSEPLDTAPPVTQSEVAWYVEALVDLLMRNLRSDDTEVAEETSAVLPRSIANMAFLTRPDVAAERFELLVEMALAEDARVQVSELSGQLQITGDRLRKATPSPNSEAEDRVQRTIEKVDSLIGQLGTGNFSVRLKRLAGGWTLDDYDTEVDEHGESLPRSALALRNLALEVIEQPEILTEDLLEWLCSPAAQKTGDFFLQLGKLDLGKEWLQEVKKLGARAECAIPFSAYLQGVAEHDRSFVESLLDELAQLRKIPDHVVVTATGSLGGGSSGVRRLETLLEEGRVNSLAVQASLPGRWTETLNPNECLRLLRALAGANLEHTMTAVRVATYWSRLGKPLDRDLASFVRRCVEAAHSSSQYDDYQVDHLAAALARRDSEEGLQLLKAVLSRPDGRGWDPIDHHGQNLFWQALLEAARERALRLVVSLAQEEGPRIIGIPQLLQGAIDQQADASLLISLALEDKEQAEVIAQSITAAKDGFWPLALKILERYPDNEVIQSGVELGIRRVQGGYIPVIGSLADRYEEHLAEIEQVLDSEETPEVVRPWLERFATSLRDKITEERIAEADEDVNL